MASWFRPAGSGSSHRRPTASARGSAAMAASTCTPPEAGSKGCSRAEAIPRLEARSAPPAPAGDLRFGTVPEYGPDIRAALEASPRQRAGNCKEGVALHVLRLKRSLGRIAVGALAAAATLPGPTTAVAAGVLMHPTVSDYAQISTSTTPPSEAQCESVGRTCFTPQALQSAYNLGPLYAQGLNGRGITIAIVDSYGSDTIAHDLHVFDQAFGLQPMCGEEGVTCAAGMPTFSVLNVQGSPPTNSPPPNNGTGQENHTLWDLEVSLDVETSHAIAPMANILLVT